MGVIAGWCFPRKMTKLISLNSAQILRCTLFPVFVFFLQKDTRGGNTNLPKLDLNVIPVWNQNITGYGVKITVLDDGKI